MQGVEKQTPPLVARSSKITAKCHVGQEELEWPSLQTNYRTCWKNCLCGTKSSITKNLTEVRVKRVTSQVLKSSKHEGVVSDTI